MGLDFYKVEWGGQLGRWPLRQFLLITIILLASSSLFGHVGRGDRFDVDVYARIDLRGLDHNEREALKAGPFVWWQELDDVLLVRSNVTKLPELRRCHAVEVLPMKVNDAQLVTVSASHGLEQDEVRGVMLAEGGRRAIFSLFEGYRGDDLLAPHGDMQEKHACGVDVSPFVPNQVLSQMVVGQPMGLGKRAGTDVVVDAIDATRWLCDVAHLATYDRETGEEDLTEAGTWLFDEFSALPDMAVSKQEFSFAGHDVFNVVARLEGQSNPDDIYIIGAHYDAIASRDGGGLAPGAEDNASGTAAVLEMARIFSVHRPQATLIFVCYSVEEQGLVGSAVHAQSIVDSEEMSQVKAVFTFDMIGFSEDSDLDVLIEGSNNAAFMIDALAQAAATYTDLRVVTSFNPFGSDHVPYINRGMPAVLSIQNDWSSYPGYHRSSDTVDQIVEVMGHSIMKMNVAAIANMAGVDTSKFNGPTFLGLGY